MFFNQGGPTFGFHLCVSLTFVFRAELRCQFDLRPPFDFTESLAGFCESAVGSPAVLSMFPGFPGLCELYVFLQPGTCLNQCSCSPRIFDSYINVRFFSSHSLGFNDGTSLSRGSRSELESSFFPSLRCTERSRELLKGLALEGASEEASKSLPGWSSRRTNMDVIQPKRSKLRKLPLGPM